MEEAGPKRPKKGGTWQRQQAESAENSAESALSILLMTYLAQGVLSGACVHAIAVAAKHDLSKAEQGYCLPKLDALAKLKHGKNLQQSVLNKLSQETNLPKPAEVDVPLAGGPSNVASSCIMLPHELFSAFFLMKPHGLEACYLRIVWSSSGTHLSITRVWRVILSRP